MLKRRTLIRIISFVSALVVALGILSITGWQRANLYKEYIRYSYQRSYGQLASSLNNISSALAKSSYSSTPAMTSMLATIIWKECDNAQALIGDLPDTNESINQLSKYVAQVGSYARATATDMVSSQEISSDYRANLSQLAGTANQLSESLSEYQTLMDQSRNNTGSFGEFMLLSTERAAPPFDLGDNMKELNGNFPEYPSLVYDGAYSDHIEQREPLFIKDKEEVDKDAARAVLAKILDLSPAQLTVTGESEGTIATWIISSSAGGADIYAEITKAGGHLLNFTSSRAPRVANLSTEQAIEKAKEYLAKMGYANMNETTYNVNGNRIFIDFVYSENEMNIYPDLVQIGLSLEDGSLSTVQARDYMMNHSKRTLQMPAVQMNDALSMLNGDLTLSGPGKLALIPTDGQNEALAYEFRGSGADGNDYMTYINAATGVEQKFSMVTENESGMFMY